MLIFIFFEGNVTSKNLCSSSFHDSYRGTFCIVLFYCNKNIIRCLHARHFTHIASSSTILQKSQMDQRPKAKSQALHIWEWRGARNLVGDSTALSMDPFLGLGQDSVTTVANFNKAKVI